MLQFIIWIAIMIAFGALLKAAIATSIWLYVLCMVAVFAFGWTLQTDDEKASVKAWW